MEPQAKAAPAQQLAAVQPPEMPFTWWAKVDARGQIKEECWTVRGLSQEKWFQNIETTLTEIHKRQPAPLPVSQPPAGEPEVEPPATDDELVCPKCGSECYDNREDRKPDDKRPLIKCTNTMCDYRVWPTKTNKVHR